MGYWLMRLLRIVEVLFPYKEYALLRAHKQVENEAITRLYCFRTDFS